jgi:AP2 domain/HNH endonuclease
LHPIRIPVAYSEEHALVDEADADLVYGYSWRAISPANSHTTYAIAHIPRYGRDVYMHRLILGLADVRGLDVDHKNGNGLDNTHTNLRLATPSQNHANTGLQRNNTSGFKGVSYAKDRNRWHAYIKVNQRRTSLGHYNTAEQAARAYDAAALEAWGSFARLNFPARLR